MNGLRTTRSAQLRPVRRDDLRNRDGWLSARSLATIGPAPWVFPPNYSVLIGFSARSEGRSLENTSLYVLGHARATPDGHGETLTEKARFSFGTPKSIYPLNDASTQGDKTMDIAASTNLKDSTTANTYPQLSELTRMSGLLIKPTYTKSDAAALFGVSIRTIQSHAADGSLPSRSLLGRARFLPIDLETFLQRSVKNSRA